MYVFSSRVFRRTQLSTYSLREFVCFQQVTETKRSIILTCVASFLGQLSNPGVCRTTSACGRRSPGQRPETRKREEPAACDLWRHRSITHFSTQGGSGGNSPFRGVHEDHGALIVAIWRAPTTRSTAEAQRRHRFLGYFCAIAVRKTPSEFLPSRIRCGLPVRSQVPRRELQCLQKPKSK